MKDKDADKAASILKETNTYQGYSGSKRLQAALQDASAKSNELPSGQGIKYSKLDVQSGTAEVRIVSPEEFVKGIKD